MLLAYFYLKTLYMRLKKRKTIKNRSRRRNVYHLNVANRKRKLKVAVSARPKLDLELEVVLRSKDLS